MNKQYIKYESREGEKKNIYRYRQIDKKKISNRWSNM